MPLYKFACGCIGEASNKHPKCHTHKAIPEGRIATCRQCGQQHNVGMRLGNPNFCPDCARERNALKKPVATLKKPVVAEEQRVPYDKTNSVFYRGLSNPVQNDPPWNPHPKLSEGKPVDWRA